MNKGILTKSVNGKILAIIENYKTKKFQITFECEDPEGIRPMMQKDTRIILICPGREGNGHIQED